MLPTFEVFRLWKRCVLADGEQAGWQPNKPLAGCNQVP
jgi:hypothetical protein